MEKSTFGVIVGTRGFFSPALALAGRRQFLGRLAELGYPVVILPEDETPTGCVETLEDAVKCADLFSKNKDKISGILVSLPNFGDEIGIVESILRSELKLPLMVHAFDDERDKMQVENRRDAFCGKLSVCNNLRQCGIPFTNTTWHTTPVAGDVFAADLLRFDRICRVYRGVNGARVAQIGTRPEAFRTVRFSEKLLQRSGVTVVPVDLSEIIAAARAVTDKELIRAKLEEIRDYATTTDEGYGCDISSGLEKNAKFAIAVESWMRKNRCVAGAIQCWDSLQKNFGCAACLTMSMLSEKGMPMACETDIAGAIAMYALYLAGDAPSAYLDWNNSFGEDRDMCIAFHCSAYPKSFFGTKPNAGCMDIVGLTVGFDNCFGSLKAQVRSGPFTFANLETDDCEGRIKMYVGEGSFTDDPVDTVGSPAVCRIHDLQTLLDYMCKNGFHHHVAMNRGNSAGILKEVFETYFGWDVYHHGKTARI